MKSEAVVTKALSGLRRSALVVPSLTNKVMDGIAKYLSPRPVLTRMFGRLFSSAFDQHA